MTLCTAKVGKAPCIAEAAPGDADGYCVAHRAERRVLFERLVIREAATKWSHKGEAQARLHVENAGLDWPSLRPRIASLAKVDR